MPEAAAAVKKKGGHAKVEKIDLKESGSGSGTDSDSEGSMPDLEDTGPTSDQSKVILNNYSTNLLEMIQN